MSSTGQTLYRRARKVMPGGTQLLSKRPEMFLPGQWPTYYRSAKGAEVVDLDGKTYLDMSYCGIGATVLGYADPDVNAAVKTAIDMGSMSTLNCADDVELAELLIELHPWADMVRFGRAGGEAMAIAVRIARAATGRDMVAFCGYHGWHDWYLSANLGETAALDGHLLPGLAPKGVPRGLSGLMHPFHFNKLDEIETIVAGHGERLAAIVMEPVRSTDPAPGFLKGIRSLADRCGAALIFDEVTAGFRLNSGGAHLAYGVDPDVAVFAKALGNGFPIAAIIGRHSVMDAAQETFVSSTAWTERVGPVAGLATLRKHREQNVARHLIRIGTRVQRGWQDAAGANDLPIQVSGMAPLGHFVFDRSDAQEIKTLFTQMMLDKGILAHGSFYAMLAHTDAHVDRYLEAVNEVFRALKIAIDQNAVRQLLRGPVAHSGFKRLT
ncbi:MAG TPA: aminotransferase class III-fold pyridoxal phosphate-dependent enzyme [Bradyrhizobium sp.]|jgi:glutamate-1-semialdehyde 2,1-aminomutase|uniref:aminotransferase class III-fold pyridoxal phosphate-dependent enzyme n=1 Tax=Bradyrhizobium sp. TaxID=376 RepID=UPI002C077E69|nr:aminotransferase class III-fold pyridoxal phosphate-dependent enzyme [Bradyrhizobium sp.]HTB04915.1 aminotransferase class III-fold pyridoxal phosphate-dependent enzyme [Bradyrhizobium sp.]